MLSTAFIPAAGVAPATRAYSAARITAAPRVARARSAAPRWRLMTSSSPDPGTQKPTSSPVEPASPASNATGSAPPTVDYAIDGEELLERARLVAVDVSERPFYYSKIAGYAVGALVVLTVLRAVVSAIDSLPVLPAALELIGLGYAAWFVWRYVLFRESRAELLEEIDEFLGRTRPRSD